MTLQLDSDNTENNKSVSDLDLDSKKKKELLGVVNDCELTDVERTYSLNALRIFKERYLLKDNAGNTVERLDQLFKRVAMGVGIMEVLYDQEWYSKDGSYKYDSLEIKHFENRLKAQQRYYKDLDYKHINGKEHIYDWGDGFYINVYHYERLLARYIELAKEGKIHKNFTHIVTYLQHPNLYPEFKNKYFPLIKKYYDLMANKFFLPNTPALMNVGTKLGQNAACFTLDMEDDLHDIYQTYTDAADIFKSGGGIGVNYSKLRPKGALVKGTGGVSSGTLSWLRIMDLGVVDVVKQGGKRRGAAMGILNMNHPAIEEFIDLKKDNKTLTNHNISVNTPDVFFYLALNDPKTHCNELLPRITKNAWLSGDPGMVFEDNMNSNNLLEPVLKRKIDVTNPCSEISMYPYESCILASINLTKFVDSDNNDKKEFDEIRFMDVVQDVTQFLDSMIDATKYPLEKINDMTKKCRRIGVGYMGIADTLVKLGIKYNSKEGFDFIEKISRIMTFQALHKSSKLARQKGAFPLWYDEKYPKGKLPVNELMGSSYDSMYWAKYGLRNCSVTTIAPTGTLSMFVDCSSGIEPIFSKNFTKNVTLGEFEYGNQESDVLITAMEMHPFDHIMAQAVAQKWISNGISKTINLPEDCSEKLIEYCYVLAWALGNKGISVYRDNCKKTQVLNNSKRTSIDDVNPISEYTIQIIKNLNNLPEEYKQEMLSRKNEKAELEKDINERVEMKCGNCGESTYIEKTTRTCYICRNCGHQIGGCS